VSSPEPRFGEIYPTTPQAQRRFLGRWLDRDEGLSLPKDERPRQTGRGGSGPSRLMFSAVALTAAIALLAFGTRFIDRDPELDPGPVFNGAVHSVGAGGLGDYATIAAAVAAATDGDTVLVKPGTYAETVVIDKDIQLLGEGPRTQVIITAPTGSPLWTRCVTGDEREPVGCALVVDHVDATVANLTFRGDDASVSVFGGQPTLRDLVFQRVGEPVRRGLPGSGGPLSILDGSTVLVRDNVFQNSAGIEIRGGSAPTIERNELTGGTFIAALEAGDGTVLRNNGISDTAGYAIEIFSPTRMLIEDNTIRRSGGPAIQVGGKFNNPAFGIDPIIRGNAISDGGAAGIVVHGGGDPVIENNTLLRNRLAIQIGRSPAIVTGNFIRGGDAGIVIVSGGDPSVVGNDIDVSGRGIAIGQATSPHVEGNVVCGGEVSINVADDATPLLGENDTCKAASKG